ncbi:MAG: hypothetical protein N4A50_10750 [Vallitalea sp.]|jgi:hypothetical protein|nr:hypothetical protein [Vallitalea sp.]
MRIPIFLGLFIIFIVVIKIKMNKAENIDKNISKEFWKKEEKSMFARKKSLESLDYIYIDSNSLPSLSKEQCDDDIFIVQEKVLELIQHKIVNLNGQTNTDLRLQYGTANLDKLILYEDRYNILIKRLYKWAKLLYEKDKINESIAILELGVSIKTDISEHYILLAKLYKLKNDTNSFHTLYTKVQNMDFILKNKVVSTMDSL